MKAMYIPMNALLLLCFLLITVAKYVLHTHLDSEGTCCGMQTLQ